MPAPRAKSFLYADLARALRNRDQHDVHQANAADAQREQSDETEKNFDTGGDDAKIEEIGKHVKDEDGAFVLGIEVVVEGHGAANGVRDFLVVAFIFHGDGIEIVSVGQIAHGAERDVDLAVHVVVAVLDGVFEHSDNFVGNAVEADFLTERILTGEKLLLDI